MRIRGSILCAILAGASALAEPAHAQFQPPNPDELKMTADPKAPGADAVILELRELDNNPLHYRTFYERIKVLTEKGKGLASVEIPFVQHDTKIRQIQGRTIHPDGSILPLTVNPNDLLLVGTGDLQLRRKVFTLPGVEVGSLLEFQYDIDYQDDEYYLPHWEIERKYYAHKEHFEFLAAEATLFTYRLPAGTSVKANNMSGDYTLDVNDVQAAPNEEWMPPIDTLFYAVSFYYWSALTEVDFWKQKGKEWSDSVNKFAETSRTIRDVVNGIVAPEDNDLEKAKKLYAAVQALDNTDFSRTKTASERHALHLKNVKHAEDTWQQKSGSSDDIALLYLAMARAAGLTAYAVDIVDRNRSIFDPADLQLEQLDSVLVQVTADGQPILVDPGEKMCPFGTLSWRHSFTEGIGQSPQGIAFTQTPGQNYLSNVVKRAADLTVDSRGGVTGSCTIVMTGQEALRWRQAALENDSAELKRLFDADLEAVVPDSVEAHVDHFSGLDDPESNLIAAVNVQGVLGTAVAHRLLVPGFFFDSHAPVPFVNEAKRVTPVDMHYGGSVVDQVTYRLPAGLTVEGAPQEARISWPDHAVFVSKIQTQPTEITITHSISNAFTAAKAEEYNDLRGFYQKVAAADQQQLVLSAAVASSGN